MLPFESRLPFKGEPRNTMRLRPALSRFILGLSRGQKRAIFLSVDTALAPILCLAMLDDPQKLTAIETAYVFVGLTLLAATASLLFGLPRIKLNAYGQHAVWATAKFGATMSTSATVLGKFLGISIAASDVVACGTLILVTCVASRYVMLNTLRWTLRQRQPKSRVLIYGAGETGLQIALALQNHARILPVAFLDDDIDLQAITVAGLPVLPPTRLEQLLPDLAIDRVLLAMPSLSGSKHRQIARNLQALGLGVQTLPSFAQLAGTEPLEIEPTIDGHAQLLDRDVLRGELPNVDATYGGQVIFVSGAGGSVGSELCRQLAARQPKALILFERSEIALYTVERELKDLTLGSGIKIVSVLGSVTDLRFASNTMTANDVSIVFHAAAYKHLPIVEANPLAGLENNVLGTRLLAEAAVLAGVRNFVLISTDKAVRPSSLMGASKQLAEYVVQDLASRSSVTRFSTVRFGNVLGSSGSVLPLFRDQIAKGGPITLTHNDVTRYFMTLEEAARLVLFAGALSNADTQGDVFVLDMGKPIKIRDLAERMIKAKSLTLKSRDCPSGDIEIVVTGLRPGEKLHEDTLFGGALMPTAHPKIMRSKDVGMSESALGAILASTRHAIKAGDQDAARCVLSSRLDQSQNRHSNLAPYPQCQIHFLVKNRSVIDQSILRIRKDSTFFSNANDLSDRVSDG